MDTTSLQAAAELLRVVAHPTRLHLIQMILQRAYSVGELAESCRLPSAIVSGHLRLMQRHGLLAGERDGRQIFYQVVEPSLPCILNWIANQFGNPASIGGVCFHHKWGTEVMP
jgi:ArsR family transcriptional regulator, zinc-responsive transcriptional repressor